MRKIFCILLVAVIFGCAHNPNLENTGSVTGLGPSPFELGGQFKWTDANAIANAIDDNAADISTNTTNISTNTANISTNSANIATNTADILTNTAEIATKADSGANSDITSLSGLTTPLSISQGGTGSATRGSLLGLLDSDSDGSITDEPYYTSGLDNTPRSSEPTSPVDHKIYVADSDTWNPCASDSTTDYYVKYYASDGKWKPIGKVNGLPVYMSAAPGTGAASDCKSEDGDIVWADNDSWEPVSSVKGSAGYAVLNSSSGYDPLFKLNGTTILDDVIKSGANTYYPDSGSSDQGATSLSYNTVYDIVTAIGTTNKASIVFRHTSSSAQTSYVFDTTIDLSAYANIHFIFELGAILSRTTGDETVTFFKAENILSGDMQQITAVDMVRFTNGGTVYAGWWGAIPGLADSGTPLQYAINSVGGVTYASIVKIAPGNYTATTTVNIEFSPWSVLDMIGSVWSKSNSGSAFSINANHTTTPNYAEYYFGYISHVSGSAIRSYGQFANAYISWQGIVGTSRAGYGLYLDSDTTDGGAAQSVITIDAGYVYNEQYGIYLSSNTNIDTITANTKSGFIYNNDIGLYVRSQSAGNQINTNVWNLNIDASVTGSDISVKTNEAGSRFNLIVGGIGAYNIVLGSYDGHSAQYNDLTNCRPVSLSYGSTYLSDTSTNNTNIYPRVNTAPITLSVGSSPWTYQNDLHQDMYVTISGGTVSAIELSHDNITFYPIASATGTMALIPKHMYMRITYSSAPSAYGYLY